MFIYLLTYLAGYCSMSELLYFDRLWDGFKAFYILELYLHMFGLRLNFFLLL